MAPQPLLLEQPLDGGQQPWQQHHMHLQVPGGQVKVTGGQVKVPGGQVQVSGGQVQVPGGQV